MPRPSNAEQHGEVLLRSALLCSALLYLLALRRVAKQAAACAVVIISRTRSTAYFSQCDRNRVDLNKIPALSSC